MHSRLLIFRALCVVGLTIVFFGAASAAASPHRVAVLQGLDKVTARVSTLSAPIGATVRFGTLEIIVRYCDKRPPEETLKAQPSSTFGRRGEASRRFPCFVAGCSLLVLP